MKDGKGGVTQASDCTEIIVILCCMILRGKCSLSLVQ